MDFHIFTKDIKIGDTTYTLRPLTGRFLPKLYGVITKLTKEDGNVNLSELNENNIKDLHLLALETFKKSYPQENEEKIDEFVSQNLMPIITALVEVNLASTDVTKS